MGATPNARAARRRRASPRGPGCPENSARAGTWLGTRNSRPGPAASERARNTLANKTSRFN
eukprot:1356643-Lingulodinium_polyedra.AAC.1